MIEEEDFDEIYSEPERISLKFHEMLACINENTDHSSAISDDIDFEDFENFEKKIKEQKSCNERDETIESLEQARFTSYVIVDYIEGKFQWCEETRKLR